MANALAIALSKKIGIQTNGRMEDAARFASGSFNDLSMALSLKA